MPFLDTARVWICIASSLSAVGAVAQSQSSLPVTVQRELAQMTTACKEVGGKSSKSPGLLTIADFTSDGVLDFVLYQGLFNCEGAASLFSLGAQGGGQVIVYIGTPDGQATEAFNDGALDVKIDNDTKPAKLHLMNRGQFCGQKISDKMSRSEYKACWRPVIWNERSKKLEYAPLSQIQPIP